MEYRAHAIRSAVRIQAVVRSRLAKKQFWMTQAMGILERGGPVSAALAPIRKLPPFEVAQILATQTEERSGEVARELPPRELGKAIRHLRPRRASCLFRFMEEEKGARVLEELDAEQNAETIELIANLPQLVGKAKDRCARDGVASVSVPKGAKCLDEMRASRAQKLLQEIPYLRKSAEIIECMLERPAGGGALHGRGRAHLAAAGRPVRRVPDLRDARGRQGVGAGPAHRRRPPGPLPGPGAAAGLAGVGRDGEARLAVDEPGQPQRGPAAARRRLWR